MLQELVTPSGYRFWGESLVTIDGVDYPLDELTREQRSFVLAVRDVNALNAAYAGRAEFRAEGLPAFEEVFPEIAAERSDIKVCKVNVDEQPELAGQFGVMSIPTLVVVKDGKIVRQSVGARPKSAILAML